MDRSFVFVNAGGGYYYIENVGSKLVLDVRGGIKKPGTNVWQHPKNGTDAQKWRLIVMGSGYYRIQSKLGNLNLDVHNAAQDNTANIKVWSSNGSDATEV